MHHDGRCRGLRRTTGTASASRMSFAFVEWRSWGAAAVAISIRDRPRGFRPQIYADAGMPEVKGCELRRTSFGRLFSVCIRGRCPTPQSPGVDGAAAIRAHGSLPPTATSPRPTRNSSPSWSPAEARSSLNWSSRKQTGPHSPPPLAGGGWGRGAPNTQSPTASTTVPQTNTLRHR
jgi:hypothetical protein